LSNPKKSTNLLYKLIVSLIVSFKNWKAPVNESAIKENTFPNAFINGFNVDNNSLRLFIKSINALLNPPPPESVSNAFKNSLPKARHSY
jgi:hypothetical protein